MACNVIYEPSLSPFKYCSVCGFLTPKSSLCCFSFEKHAFGSFWISPLSDAIRALKIALEVKIMLFVVCWFFIPSFSLSLPGFLSLSFSLSLFTSLLRCFIFSTIFIDKSWVESKVGDIKSSNEKKTFAAFHVYAFASLPLVDRVGMFFLPSATCT